MKQKPLAQNQREILEEYLALMKKAESVLEHSYAECRGLVGKDSFTLSELDHLEALTSRFARYSDMFIQKILRFIESAELEQPGTIRDRLNNAEKWGIIERAETYVFIRELRNSIANEYEPNAVNEIFHEVLEMTPELLTVRNRVETYCRKFLNRADRSANKQNTL